MIKPYCIAYGVRVKLTEEFQEKCLGDKYLRDEKVLFISCEKSMNDSEGPFISIKGGSLLNSGVVRLNEIELEFPVPDKPLYTLY